MEPPPRTLRVVSPLMRGPDVTDVQRLLGVDADGIFGPITSGAVRAWKRSRGDPAPNGDLTPNERAQLLVDVPLRAVRLMERWAGDLVAEEPPRSNRVPSLIALAGQLQVAPAYSGMGYPWCAFAALLSALAAGGECAQSGLRKRLFNPLYTPAILQAAKDGMYGLRLVPAVSAFRGDLVLFDWNFNGGDPADHVGRLTAAPVDGRIHTVDGNSGTNGLVQLRDRAIASVRAFARDA